MNGGGRPRMGPAMARTELSSLPLAPSIRDRLLRAGFRTLRDVEGVQPLDLSRGEACWFAGLGLAWSGLVWPGLAWSGLFESVTAGFVRASLYL